MKKWIALLLALCMLLPCAALGETAAEETAEEAAEITPHDIRYYFEHRLLPSELYENTEQLTGFLRKNGIYALWANFTGSNGFAVVYPEDAFGMAEFPQEDGTNVMMISLPKPEDSPLCSRVYLFWNPETGKTGYYTVELDSFFGEAWYLCGWSADGNHLDYGTINALPDPEDPGYADALQAEIAAVLELMNSDVQPAGSYNPSTGEIGTGN